MFIDLQQKMDTIQSNTLDGVPNLWDQVLGLNQSYKHQKIPIVYYQSVVSAWRDSVGLISDILDAYLWRWLEYLSQSLFARGIYPPLLK